jgi:hypothetical protein
MLEGVVMRLNMPEEIRSIIEAEPAGRGNSFFFQNWGFPHWVRKF